MRNPFKQDMKTWNLVTTLLTLNQLRDRAMDLGRTDEYKRYNDLIEIAQEQLRSKNGGAN